MLCVQDHYLDSTRRQPPFPSLLRGTEVTINVYTAFVGMPSLQERLSRLC